MKVNKLKLAALAMSAITCLTSVPNVAFAEDFAAAFTSGAETEAVAEDIFSADENAVAGDAFDVFLFDDGAVEDQQSSVGVGQYPTQITFHYDEAEYADFAVTYMIQDTDSAGNPTGTPHGNPNNNNKPYISETVAKQVEIKEPTCVSPRTFKLQITSLKEFSNYQFPGGALTSTQTYNEKGSVATGIHTWVEKRTNIVAPTCTAVGTDSIDYECSVCSQLRSVVEAEKADGFKTYTEEVDKLGHEKPSDPQKIDTVYVPVDNCTLVNGEIVVTDPSKDAKYGVYEEFYCNRCKQTVQQRVGEKDVTIPFTQLYKYVIEYDEDTKSNIAASGKALLTRSETTRDEDKNKAPEYPTLPNNNDIELIDCERDGYYYVVGYNGNDNVSAISKDKIVVPAHHTSGIVEIYTKDKTQKVVIDTRTNTITGKDRVKELDIICANHKITVKSINCKPCEYTEIVYCGDKKHVISEGKKTADATEGAHVINKDAYNGLKNYANSSLTLVELDANYGSYEHVELTPVTATCKKAGTVKVDFTCTVCNAALDVDVKEVSVKAGTDHKKPLVAETKDYTAATCTTPGGFTSIQTCSLCKEEVSKTDVVIPASHKYLSDEGITKDNNVVLGFVGDIVIDDGAYTYGTITVTPAANNKQQAKERVGIATVGANVTAGVYDVCTVCGARSFVPLKNVKISVNKRQDNGGKYCQEGIINLTATYKKVSTNEAISLTQDFPYYKTEIAYQGRTPHQGGTPVKENEKTNEDGSKSYDSVVYCTLCKYEMSRNTFTETPSEHKHNMTKVPAVEATCDKAGNVEYWTCDAEECAGKYYADEKGENQYTAEQIVVPAAHKLEAVEAVEATCTTDGVKAHYICSVCGKLFEDAEGTKEISKEDTIVKANGEHKPGEAVVENYVEAQAFTSGSYDTVVYCEVCKEEISRETATIPALRKPYATAVTGLHSNIYPDTETARIYFTAKEGVDDYRINYRIAGTGSAGYDAVDGGRVRTDGSNNFVVSGLKKGALYDFRVAAGNYVDEDATDVVWGARSGYNRRWMQTVETVNIKAGTGNITVQWVEPTSATASKYEVYYSPNKDMSGQKYVTVKGGTNTVTISGLEKGTRYYVRIRPYAQESKKTYSGSLSNRVSAKVK